MDCGRCDKFHKQNRSRPPCQTHCNNPGLWPENRGVLEVLNAARPVMFDGFGGVRLDNVRLVAEGLGYDWDEALLRKLTAAAGVLQEKKS